MKFCTALFGAGFIFMAFGSTPISAGNLTKDSYIVRMGSTNHNNSSEFFITVEGGAGKCKDINFTQEAGIGGDQSSMFKRNYALAMLAMSSNMKISVHNYSSDDCSGASLLEVYR